MREEGSKKKSEVYVVRHLTIDQFHVDETTDSIDLFDNIDTARKFAIRLFNRILKSQGCLIYEFGNQSFFINKRKTVFQCGCDEGLNFHEIRILKKKIKSR